MLDDRKEADAKCLSFHLLQDFELGIGEMQDEQLRQDWINIRFAGKHFVRVRAKRGLRRIFSLFVSDADVARICTGTAGPTRDPRELLAAAERLTRAVPGSPAPGPAWGGDRSAGEAGATDQDAEDAEDAA